MSLLEKINSPADLKLLNREQLETLSGEIRQLIITTVAANGGHLASNLGAVELTLALLCVFDQPKDKIVWDVGHQCYTHKILTGRFKKFKTLRKHGGISGFPRCEESPYDAFNTGHSGTSISTGGGILEAGYQTGRDYRVISVIGDGSMTSGLAFEGLNQMGHLKRDLIVVLNDNEMSISPNVGALSSYMNRLMTGHLSTRLREELEKFLKGVPGFGEQVFKIAKKAEELMKATVIPGILFEELGFKYVGPIPGHQTDHLIQTFKNVRAIPKPILVHVITKKGKGYKPAETDPANYHGVGPFDPKTGKTKKSEGPPTYTEVFGETIVDLAEKDHKVVAITAAMAKGTGLDRFAERFPDRFYDVGIAEQHAVAFAAGMASAGMKPVVAIYSTFLQRAFDQVVHDVSLTSLPVVLALDRAGIVGEDGPTHQGLFDLSYLRGIPEMIIMSPKDEEELRHMIFTALSSNRPTAVRYPRGRGVGVPREKEYRKIDIGKAEILVEGDDLAIMAVGSSVHPSLEAAGELLKKGIKCTVINARFVKPLDKDAVARAGACKKIITVEENVLNGGFGSAVLETMADMGLDNVKVKRIGIPDKYVEHGKQSILRRNYGLDSQGIMETAEAFMARRNLKASRTR